MGQPPRVELLYLYMAIIMVQQDLSAECMYTLASLPSTFLWIWIVQMFRPQPAKSYFDQSWPRQCPVRPHHPHPHSTIVSFNQSTPFNCQTYLLSTYQSIELLSYQFHSSTRTRLTPHRSATVVNSFPTPWTSSSFLLRTLVCAINPSNDWILASDLAFEERVRYGRNLFY